MKKVIFSRSTALIGLTASLVMLSSPQKPVQKAAQKALQNNRLSQSAQSLSETDVEPDAQYVFDDSDLALTQSFQDVRYQELSESIQSFLAALDEQQRAAVVRAFDDPFRTRAFCYVLARCNDEFVGLQIQDLDSEQKIALNNLLMKSFSGSGYTRAIQTMNREWLVEETENAHRADPENYPTVGSPLVEEWTPPAKRAAPNYYIAFFGEPASTEPWGLRFEGHHLSFNLTFGGEGEQPTVGIAPMFFGSSPMIIQKAPDVAAGEENPYPQWQQQEGQQLLHREAWLARSFLKSLDADTLQPGTWSELPDVVLAGGAEVPLDVASYLEGEQPGISVAALSPVQQELMLEFALEFLELQSSAHIDVDAFKANLATARVWWFGDRDDEQADLYFRIQSDRYLIELLQSNTFAVVSEIDSNHVHASFRDLTNDWDHNALGAHYHQYHDTAVVH
ncbi:MAG: DUF3500 domain-containing protein [Cyanobacteria bacterium J06597_16]